MVSETTKIYFFVVLSIPALALEDSLRDRLVLCKEYHRVSPLNLLKLYFCNYQMNKELLKKYICHFNNKNPIKLQNYSNIDLGSLRK
jgi:hypothetical protein